LCGPQCDDPTRRTRQHQLKPRKLRRTVTDTVVVGVDGSEGSGEALRWAAGEARARNAKLHAVLAWESPVQVFGAVWAIPSEHDMAEYERLARERLDAVLDADPALLDGLEVERSAVHGAPAAVLIEAAAGADELVVGTRGHGGFVGLLLGSVGQQCTHHAPCPVVIVPQPR
jgi:nucleotide-binding universal stress UspA family protein